jgi:putative SOS response-associated peptidase YedK
MAGAGEGLMCNLYSITKTQEAMRKLFAVKQDRLGNMPPLPGVFPDHLAPVVRLKGGERELVNMRWGFPPPPKVGMRPVTNVRNTTSSFWRPWLKPEFRCLVPATSFCEYTDTSPKVPHWFALSEERALFAFAGIWRPWTGERRKEQGEHLLYSFLTTEPNSVVKPIHAKAMPVMLTTTDAFDAWLTADVDKVLELQRPLPEAELRIVAKGERKDD